MAQTRASTKAGEAGQNRGAGEPPANGQGQVEYKFEGLRDALLDHLKVGKAQAFLKRSSRDQWTKPSDVEGYLNKWTKLAAEKESGAAKLVDSVDEKDPLNVLMECLSCVGVFQAESFKNWKVNAHNMRALCAVFAVNVPRLETDANSKVKAMRLALARTLEELKTWYMGSKKTPTMLRDCLDFEVALEVCGYTAVAMNNVEPDTPLGLLYGCPSAYASDGRFATWMRLDKKHADLILHYYKNGEPDLESADVNEAGSLTGDSCDTARIASSQDLIDYFEQCFKKGDKEGLKKVVDQISKGFGATDFQKFCKDSKSNFGEIQEKPSRGLVEISVDDFRAYVHDLTGFASERNGTEAPSSKLEQLGVRLFNLFDVYKKWFPVDNFGFVVCPYAGKKALTGYEQDHIVPQVRGGPTTQKNHQFLHHKANANKSDKLWQFLEPPIPDRFESFTAKQFLPELVRSGPLAMINRSLTSLIECQAFPVVKEDKEELAKELCILREVCSVLDRLLQA